MKIIRDNKSTFFFLTGVILLVSSVLYSGCNILADVRAGRSANDIINRMAMIQSDVMQDYLLYPDMEMPTVRIEGNDYVGKLQIPLLELELPVISMEENRALRIAPCRYYGSAYNDSLVIAGHNYMSHFGRLKELSQNDEIVFVDVNGNSFFYKVCEIEILNPEDVAEMKNSTYDFTLFTCTFGGQNRLTVRCERVSCN